MVCGLEKTRSSFTIIKRLLDDYLSTWILFWCNEKDYFRILEPCFGQCERMDVIFYGSKLIFVLSAIYVFAFRFFNETKELYTCYIPQNLKATWCIKTKWMFREQILLFGVVGM